MCDAKCSSIFWCFLYMMSGIALLGVGIWTPVDDAVFDSVNIRYPELVQSKTPWRGIIGGLIALGAYCFLVGILGMAGAGCELDEKIANSLIAFAVFASFGIIATMILAAIVTANFVKIDEERYYSNAREALLSDFKNQMTDNAYIKAWNRFQIDEECCGLDNFTDYLNTGHYNSSETNTTIAHVPWSCCELLDNNDGGYFPDSSDVNQPDVCRDESVMKPNPYSGTVTRRHENGCGPVIWDRHRTWQTVLLSMSWTAVGIQLIALIVTGCMKKDALRGG